MTQSTSSIASNEYRSHYSVLFREIINWAGLGKNGEAILNIADLTFGAGGHSLALLSHYQNANIMACDQDPDAIQNGIKKINESKFQDRIKLIPVNFENFTNQLLPHMQFDAIIMDLGVSSHHFDSPSRGFSFRFEAPLDMRMNYTSNEFITAKEIVNTYSEKELCEIFKNYGEEPYAFRIAKNICEARQKAEISTTKDLENIIFHAYPKNERHEKTNPSTRVFQALRIAVNRELDVLGNTIDQLFPYLKIGGRIMIISFHSLEDRIVKNKFRDAIQAKKIPLLLQTKKPITPSALELEENPRSRSAKLRIIERVDKFIEKNKYKDRDDEL